MDADKSKKAINLTDCDSPIMKGKKGNFDTYYNTQVGCNEKGIIGYCTVVPDGNDKAQLIPTIEGIENNTSQKIEVMLADADYATYSSLEYMSKNEITGYVPYRDMNRSYKEAPYHKSHFTYQKQSDTYICPQNKELKFRRIREDKQRNQKFKEYRTDACRSCPLQRQCCPKGAARRVISREVRQDFKDEMKERLQSEEGRKLYQRRLHPVESIFGHIKYNLGYHQFLLRGLEKVKAEFTIICLTYNLMKIANFRSQILKIKVWAAYIQKIRNIMSNKSEIRTKIKCAIKRKLILHSAIYQSVTSVNGQPEKLRYEKNMKS